MNTSICVKEVVLLFKNSRVLSIVIPVVLAIIAGIIDQARYTTYEDFLDEYLEENEEILSITITSYSLLQEKKFTTTIEDPRLIARFIEEPSMNLKGSFISSDLSRTTYPNEFHIEGASSSFTFHFNELAIHKEKKYAIEAPDKLFEFIQMEDLEWELVDERQ